MGGRVTWTRRTTAVVMVCVSLLAVAAAPATTAKPAGGGGKGGKPGYPDRLTFAGQSWQVKSSAGAVGPGPNVFSSQNATVDVDGNLHLQITQRDGTWTSAEVIADTSFGYGTYTFTIASAVHDLDPNVVLGLFTWSDNARFHHREIDVELARWGRPLSEDPTNAQFVVQPHDSAGHLHRFLVGAAGPTTYSFTWTAGRVSFWSSTGEGFVYAANDVPKAGGETPRINLWLFEGRSPTNGEPVEVVVSGFQFTPAPA